MATVNPNLPQSDEDRPVVNNPTTASDTSSKTKCIVCKEEICTGAVKCIHCDSYQDWRNYLTFSSTVLALLVALVSVSGFVVPILDKALTPTDSRIIVSYQTIAEGFGGPAIILLVSNSGTKPGTFATAQMEMTTKNGRRSAWDTFLIGSGAGEGFIPSGQTKRLELNPQIPNGLLADDISSGSFLLRVDVIEFKGARHTLKFDIPAGDVQKLLKK